MVLVGVVSAGGMLAEAEPLYVHLPFVLPFLRILSFWGLTITPFEDRNVLHYSTDEKAEYSAIIGIGVICPYLCYFVAADPIHPQSSHFKDDMLPLMMLLNGDDA